MRFYLFFILSSFFSFSQVTHTVNAGMFYYEPANLIINQGDVVVWINDQGFHDVNGEVNSITNEPFSNPETFDSPATGEVGAEIYTHTFNISGFYNYDCSVGTHAEQGMVGTITVNPVEENSIEGIWSFGNDFLYITENELTIFFYEDKLDCLIEIPYSYTSSEPGTITLIDSYYGYTFDIEIFVDNNGDLNILPPEEDVEIWSASTLDINSITSMTCSQIDYNQMIGQWELTSMNDVNLSEGLHYMEIFGNGTTIQYDYDVDNNCYEITELTVEFYNDFGEALLTFEDGVEIDAIIIINDSGELAAWVNDQEEVWNSTSFDPLSFNDCSNVSLMDFEEFDASIFPNPAKDNLLVELSHPGEYELIMMNIDGKKIFDGNFKDACNVDVSFLSNGVYLVHIFNSERSIIKTIYLE